MDLLGQRVEVMGWKEMNGEHAEAGRLGDAYECSHGYSFMVVVYL